MKRSALGLSLIVVIAACGDEPAANFDGGSADTGEADGGADAGSADTASADTGSAVTCTWTSSGTVGRPDLEEGRIAGAFCNECDCQSSGTITCTQIACPMEIRCTSHTDCGAQGFCHFDPGCVETMGYCMSGQSRCKDETNPAAPAGQTAGIVCGCDGTTYEATECFGIRWEGYGPC